MVGQEKYIEIEVCDTEDNWHDVTVSVKIEESDQDTMSKITNAAIRFCSRKGFNYETWE
jgi:hypothetical protein